MLKAAGSVAALIAALGANTRAVDAEVLSGRPITVVVPFPPGASADTLMRLVTKTIGDKTGQLSSTKTGQAVAVRSPQPRSSMPTRTAILCCRPISDRTRSTPQSIPSLPMIQ